MTNNVHRNLTSPLKESTIPPKPKLPSVLSRAPQVIRDNQSQETKIGKQISVKTPAAPKPKSAQVFHAHHPAASEENIKKQDVLPKQSSPEIKPAQPLEIIRLPLRTNAPTNSTPEHLSAIQQALDSKKIPLDCLHVPQLQKANDSNPDQIKSYLDSLPLDSRIKILKSKLFANLNKITYAELRGGLTSCCHKLQELLGTHDYAVGILHGKSQEWIAQLALPSMKKMPVDYFQPLHDNLGTPSKKGKSRSYLNVIPQVKHLVIFDDSSYSGSQAMTIIYGFENENSRLDRNEKFHVYLVIPFISSLTEKALKEKLTQKSNNFEVHVITTERKIVAVVDVFTEAEMDELISLECNGVSIYCNARRLTKCLTFTEWKIPDTASLPNSLKYEGYSWKFLTDFEPPYKG